MRQEREASQSGGINKKPTTAESWGLHPTGILLTNCVVPTSELIGHGGARKLEDLPTNSCHLLTEGCSWVFAPQHCPQESLPENVLRQRAQVAIGPIQDLPRAGVQGGGPKEFEPGWITPTPSGFPITSNELLRTMPHG